jgi:hypothetical protein
VGEIVYVTVSGKKIVAYLQLNMREKGLSAVVLESKVIVQVEGDKRAYLLSFMGEAAASVIFMGFGFHRTGVLSSALTHFLDKWSKKKAGVEVFLTHG